MSKIIRYWTIGGWLSSFGESRINRFSELVAIIYLAKSDQLAQQLLIFAYFK